MYIILEFQTDANGDTAMTPAIMKKDEKEAYSSFHSTASYAAISSVPRHTVVLLEDNGFEKERASFDHLDL